MPKHKLRNGFSIVTIIIIILILAGVGVGGYFAYNNYLAPMLNPYAKLIPDGLKEYAKGSDADGFIIIKKDADIEKIIKGFPILPAMVSDFQAGLILIKASSQTIVAVAQFSNTDSAKAVSDLIKTQLSSIKVNLEQKDKYLIASWGGNLTNFTGSLLDNPNIKNLDPTLIDSQIIVGLDTLKMQEAVQIPYTLFNSLGGAGSGATTSSILSAHAQSDFGQAAPERIGTATGGQESAQTVALTSANYLLTMAKNCFIYLRLKDDNLTGKLVVNFIAKNEIANSPLVKMMQSSGASGSAADLEKAYNEATKNLSDNLPALQKQADELQKQLPGSSVNIEFKGTTLQMGFNAPFSELQKMATEATDAAPKRARDAARKADLNNIIVAIETYYANNNKYPDKSGCSGSITEIQNDLKKSYVPVGFNQNQTFGTINCGSEYYYQSFGDRGYIMWAKMENPIEGNTSKTPDEYLSIMQSGQAPPREGSGTYFVVNQVTPLTINSANSQAISQQTANLTPADLSTQATVKKIKRSTP